MLKNKNPLTKLNGKTLKIEKITHPKNTKQTLDEYRDYKNNYV